MVNCQGCGEETSSRLCCPKCSEYGRTSFFCSQDCFVSSWPSHSKLHVIIRQMVLSTNPAASPDASSAGGFPLDEATAVSPATTAASMSATREESRFHRKLPSGVISAGETYSRSRISSRAPSETELPVVASSAAAGSYSRSSAVVPSSSSFPSRDPPILSPAPASPDADTRSDGIGTFNGRREKDDGESVAGGVLNAVRSLLLPKTRDKTEGKARGGRPAAALRVTQAVRSVFPTSQNLGYAVAGRDSKKGVGVEVAGRETAARSMAAGAVGVASPPGVGFCRCVTLVLICMFSLLFMWMMRRILFDGAGSSSAYYTTNQEEVATNRSEALSDSNDVVSAVLARIGARPYGEEISALQASVQDIRNELAAVTTLVQQHGVVIDQFIEKPNYSGRRQGGAGGAINQAISAYLEGGPPLPDTPQLKLPLIASSTSASDQKGSAGVSEAVQQEAVASPHSALRTGGAVAAGGTTVAETSVSPQKFYDASVTMEDDKVKKQANVQQPFRDSTQDQQHLQSSARQQATGNMDPVWPVNLPDANPPLSGSLMNAAVKRTAHLSESGTPLQAATQIYPGPSQEKPGSPSISTYTQGSVPQSVDSSGGISRFEQRGTAVNLPAAPAVEATPVVASVQAPDGESARQEEPIRTSPEGLVTSSSYRGSEEQNNYANANVFQTQGQYGMRVRQPFRGTRSREERTRGGKDNGEARHTELPAMNMNEENQPFESSVHESFGLGRVASRGARRDKRS